MQYVKEEPGVLERVLRAMEEILRMIKIAFDIRRLFEVGYV
jgi:hypothetical protein